jgi:rhodanese-related sulfurtransferase
MLDESPSLEVDLDRFEAAHAAGAVVLDVRNPDEYVAGHVAGAVLIPLGELGARQEEIPAGDPLYVICAVGGRSLAATQALVEAGYRAVSVAGGTNGWIERGGPVVTGPSPR